MGHEQYRERWGIFYASGRAPVFSYSFEADQDQPIAIGGLLLLQPRTPVFKPLAQGVVFIREVTPVLGRPDGVEVGFSEKRDVSWSGHRRSFLGGKIRREDNPSLTSAI